MTQRPSTVRTKLSVERRFKETAGAWPADQQGKVISPLLGRDIFVPKGRAGRARTSPLPSAPPTYPVALRGTTVTLYRRKVEVKLCDGLFERHQVLARRDVAYTYEEQIRGAKRIVDRFLVLTSKGDSAPFGTIDLDRQEVNLLAVRELAPAVARAHEVSVARAAKPR